MQIRQDFYCGVADPFLKFGLKIFISRVEVRKVLIYVGRRGYLPEENLICFFDFIFVRNNMRVRSHHPPPRDMDGRIKVNHVYIVILVLVR